MCELIDSYARALIDGAGACVPYNVGEIAERHIRMGLSRLPAREAEALMLHYGIDATPLSMRDVAQRLGLSPQRTEQLIDRGLSRLGSHLYAIEAA